MRFQMSALFFVTNILDTGKWPSCIIKVEAMNEEESAFQPRKRGLPANLFLGGEIASLQIPRTDHDFQCLQSGIRLRLLLFLHGGNIIRHLNFSFPSGRGDFY